MPKGKHDFVVWEWRALLPVLISAHGCDLYAKQHTKRQCSATVLDPSLCLHQEAPSPRGPLLFQLCFKIGQNREMMLIRSSAPLKNQHVLVRTWAEDCFVLGSGHASLGAT